MTISRRSLLLAATSLAAPGRALADINNLLAPRRFGQAEVEDRARRLASRPHEPPGRRVPASITGLDFDHWREIRTRLDSTLFHDSAGRAVGGPFHLHGFHLGHLFQRPVRLNVVNGEMADPVAYSPEHFDYGQNRFDPPLPPDLGYAGWKINYPVNAPGVFDELISFLGSSYFRLLGQRQAYGLSARGLSIGTGLLDNNEEFPFFREFWFKPPETAAGQPDVLTFYGLLDSPSVAGAYTFELRPGAIATLDVTATLFARRTLVDVGIAPLTSMYFIGENDRHYNDRNRYDDYRPEMHDSDGLALHLADGRRIWRPLRNPQIQELSYYHSRDIKGFGLMQRDRQFSNYQDVELAYEKRPSYWIEPLGDWGMGRVELVELATKDETADNIIAAWLPASPIEPDRPVTFAYRISAGLDFAHLSSLGQVVNTFNAPVGALGSREQKHFHSRRFMVDFAGGDLRPFLERSGEIQIVTSIVNGRQLRAFLTPNPQLPGLRAVIDVKGTPKDTIFMEASLQAGGKPLTETWSYRWKVE